VNEIAATVVVPEIVTELGVPPGTLTVAFRGPAAAPVAGANEIDTWQLAPG
jgi:hypothetical protein